MTNPLLEPWTAPHGAPPFDRLRPEHFPPAFDAALEEHRREIDAIASNRDAPTFENVVVANEKAGGHLQRVMAAFSALASAETNDAIQAIEREIEPRLAAHRAAILLDPALFARVDAVFKVRAGLGLDAESLRLVERVHDTFVRAGAALDERSRARIAAIEEELAGRSTRFQQNVLNDTKDWLLLLEREDDLVGLPDHLRASLAQAATAAGHDGKWAVTLARPLVEPFLAHSARRDLREQALTAFLARADRGNEHDNNRLIGEIMALRVERAKLMGYETVAHGVLADRMAKTPAAAEALMARVWTPAVKRAARERADLEALIAEEGANHALAPWDWRFYAEKLRAKRFDLDEAETMAYLTLDNVLAAQFDCAGRLFGLAFAERRDVPVYHPDVRVWEVTKDGRHVALFYGDFYARPGKQSGAWMNAWRDQNRLKGETPLVVNVLNLSKPAPGEPTLVGWTDARVLFHEFGHGLHGMLSDVTYPTLAGTAVPTDFVELPSQIYEHWIARPEVLKRFAKHWRTGEPMPDPLIAKLQAAKTFNQGFETVEFMICAMADMALHRRSDAGSIDPKSFEAEFRASIGAPDAIPMRHRLPHFLHLFAGDHYAAGYYAYLWSQVLDADGFRAFEEAGDPFDRETAGRLLEFVYSGGNSRDPAEAYRAFRGRDPDVAALLAHRGLDEAA